MAAASANRSTPRTPAAATGARARIPLVDGVDELLRRHRRRAVGAGGGAHARRSRLLTPRFFRGDEPVRRPLGTSVGRLRAASPRRSCRRLARRDRRALRAAVCGSPDRLRAPTRVRRSGGRGCFVTGASSGIGRAAAIQLERPVRISLCSRAARRSSNGMLRFAARTFAPSRSPLILPTPMLSSRRSSARSRELGRALAAGASPCDAAGNVRALA